MSQIEGTAEMMKAIVADVDPKIVPEISLMTGVSVDELTAFKKENPALFAMAALGCGTLAKAEVGDRGGLPDSIPEWAQAKGMTVPQIEQTLFAAVGSFYYAQMALNDQLGEMTATREGELANVSITVTAKKVVAY